MTIISHKIQIEVTILKIVNKKIKTVAEEQVFFQKKVGTWTVIKNQLKIQF